MHKQILIAAVIVLVSLPALAQRGSPYYSTNCPPGLKLVAGACLQSCPGGYEDHGRYCTYRHPCH